MSIVIELTCPEAGRVAEDIHEVSERYVKNIEARIQVMGLFEDVHTQHFRKLRGRYVRTGLTRQTLTQPGAGIRDLTGNEVLFGTDVWYAHFLTMGPHDPEFGQVRKGKSGKGRSAVLVSPPGLEEKVAKVMLDYIVEPVE